MNTFDIVGAIELTAQRGHHHRQSRQRTRAHSTIAERPPRRLRRVVWADRSPRLERVFDAQFGIGIGAVGAAVAVPVLLGLWAGSRVTGFRSAIAELPITL